MANINLRSIKEVRDSEITAAMEREIRTGFFFEKARQDARRKAAAMEARQHDPRKTAGRMGKPVLVVPGREFFRIQEQYGKEAWNNDEFIRDYQRLEPDAKIANV